MQKLTVLLSLLCVLSVGKVSAEDGDVRQLVQFPEMMQRHMLANMRDHLAAINEVLEKMAKEQTEEAAEVAEFRLGMSSLELHGAHHMANMMPKGMRRLGSEMHRAASRFALKAEEGDVLVAYRVLSEVTSACVACHSAYRIR